MAGWGAPEAEGLAWVLIQEPDESPAQSWRALAGPGRSGSMSKSLTAQGMSTQPPETQFFGIRRALSFGAKP